MYYRQWSQCSNLTDHKGFPIIHIYTHTDISETRDKNTSVRITDYIITDEFIQMHRTELSSSLAQQPNIYHLQMVTNNYLSV